MKKYNCYLLDESSYPPLYGMNTDFARTLEELISFYTKKICESTHHADRIPYCYEFSNFLEDLGDVLEELESHGCSTADLSGSIFVFHMPNSDYGFARGYLYQLNSGDRWMVTPFDWMYFGNKEDRCEDVEKSAIKEKAVDEAVEIKLDSQTKLVAKIKKALADTMANEVAEIKLAKQTKRAELEKALADKFDEKNPEDKGGSIWNRINSKAQ